MKKQNGIVDGIGGFIARQPWRSMWIAMSVFALAAAVNFALHAALPHISIGTPLILPFTQNRLDFTPSGLWFFVV